MDTPPLELAREIFKFGHNEGRKEIVEILEAAEQGQRSFSVSISPNDEFYDSEDEPLLAFTVMIPTRYGYANVLKDNQTLELTEEIRDVWDFKTRARMSIIEVPVLARSSRDSSSDSKKLRRAWINIQIERSRHITRAWTGDVARVRRNISSRA